jgi:hypothetical protein
VLFSEIKPRIAHHLSMVVNWRQNGPIPFILTQIFFHGSDLPSKGQMLYIISKASISLKSAVLCADFLRN